MGLAGLHFKEVELALGYRATIAIFGRRAGLTCERTSSTGYVYVRRWGQTNTKVRE